jgi:hypothetical protein
MRSTNGQAHSETYERDGWYMGIGCHILRTEGGGERRPTNDEWSSLWVVSPWKDIVLDRRMVKILVLGGE